MAPTALSLSMVPPRLPTGNGTYSAAVVSLLDSQGRPTVAVTGVNVSLTSAEASVGSVSQYVYIAPGEAYAVANFTTTQTAGSTTITAASTGLTTASSSLTTAVAVGNPTRLAVTAVPETLPSSSAANGTLFLELEDDTGLPAKAISPVNVALYSSNTNVATVTVTTATIQPGQYLEEVNYTTGFVPGSALISASAPGLSSAVATVSVAGSPPLALKLEAQPSTMVACASGVTSCSGRLVVALTDLSGNPATAPNDITVQIRSSDVSVVTADEVVTIPAGAISAIVTYNVTSATGGATIAASSPGLESSFAVVTVVAPGSVSPSACTDAGAAVCGLAIYVGPNPVLANDLSYSSVVVALENGGTPAVDFAGNTTVTLTSSVTGVGNFANTIQIPEGQNWAPVTFTSTYQVGQTQFTASAQNLLPAQTTLETYGAVPSQVVLSAITPVLPADGASHPALELSLEDALGLPAVSQTPVQVNLTSSQGDVVSVGETVVIPAGNSFKVVDVTSGVVTGTANVTALASYSTSGVTSSSIDISTMIPAPSSLGAAAPNQGVVVVSTGNFTQPPLAVQLEDSSGNLAQARALTNITITSSNSTVVPEVQNASIGVGSTFASVPLDANAPGTTTLTISAASLATASIRVTFLPYPSQETLTGGPATIFLNDTAVVVASVSLDGMPVPNVPVYWNSSSGGLVITTAHPSNTSSAALVSTTTSSTRAAPLVPLASANDSTSSGGQSVAVFHPTKLGAAVITVVIAPGGIFEKTFNFTVNVTPPPLSHEKAGLLQRITTFPLIIAPIGGAAGAGAVVLLVLRRRRGGGAPGEEDFDTSFE